MKIQEALTEKLISLLVRDYDITEEEADFTVSHPDYQHSLEGLLEKDLPALAREIGSDEVFPLRCIPHTPEVDIRDYVPDKHLNDEQFLDAFEEDGDEEYQ